MVINGDVAKTIHGPQSAIACAEHAAHELHVTATHNGIGHFDAVGFRVVNNLDTGLGYSAEGKILVTAWDIPIFEVIDPCLLRSIDDHVIFVATTLDGAVDVQVLGIDVGIIPREDGSALFGGHVGCSYKSWRVCSIGQVNIGGVLGWRVEKPRLHGFVFGGPLALGIPAGAEETV